MRNSHTDDEARSNCWSSSIVSSTCSTRNPSGTLLPFFGSGFPYIIYQQKKGYPYCNMVTGLPRVTIVAVAAVVVVAVAVVLVVVAATAVASATAAAAKLEQPAEHVASLI